MTIVLVMLGALFTGLTMHWALGKRSIFPAVVLGGAVGLYQLAVDQWVREQGWPMWSALVVVYAFCAFELAMYALAHTRAKSITIRIARSTSR